MLFRNINVRSIVQDSYKFTRKVTKSLSLRSVMATAPDAGQLMTLLLKLVNAKNTIEIGVFTGYSLLLPAFTIPDDCKV